MPDEKNIAEEIKQKHLEFDRDIQNYLAQLKNQAVRGNGAGFSPSVQKLRVLPKIPKQLTQGNKIQAA